MPQLEVATYYSQIFWLVICLLTLYVSLRYIFIPRIESSISKRQQRIESMLLDAEKMQVEAEIINKKYSEELKKAYKNTIIVHKEEISKFEKDCEKKLEKISLGYQVKLEAALLNLEESKVEFGQNLESKADSILKDFLSKMISVKEKNGD